MQAMQIALSPTTLMDGLKCLARCDPDLASILKEFGAPPLWFREPGFATLVYIILEQQVSLASAKAVYDRLLAVISPLTPRRYLELDQTSLKSIGFSRQKISYTRHLAQLITDGSLNLEALGTMDDAAVRASLLKIKGIGPWTAEIYLLMALGRPDAWPRGDLALAVAVQRIRGLAYRPNPDALEEMSRIWRPWRAVAARLFWHYYLNKPARLTIA